MNGKNKKALLLCGLFLAVIAAGYANYAITAKKAGDDGSKKVSAEIQDGETVDVFASFKNDRESSRASELSYIESVVSSAEADEATKSKAQEQKLAMVANMESELLSEGIIETKIGVSAVVAISGDSVSVVVDKEVLSEAEVTQIAEIIRTQTNKASENIKIMPKA